MKNDDVKIGQTYSAKITDKVVPVRIDVEHKSGGWHGTNMTTNRKVHIKSAQKLRGKTDAAPSADNPAKPSGVPAKKKLSAAERKALLAQHKADQENARLREEREASTEGMTASEAAMAKSGKPKRAKKPKDAPAKDKKLSLIDAAIEVLRKAKQPMNCKEMVQAVFDAKLWSPGTGKTPSATLYSAILRDLKSDTPRFEKVDRGQFQLAKGG
jgi:hypothetical protein